MVLLDLMRLHLKIYARQLLVPFAINILHRKQLFVHFLTKFASQYHSLNALISSHVTNYQVLPISNCSTSNIGKIKDKIHMILAKASQQTRRSAAGGKQGHYMTPVFVHTFSLEAFGTLS